MQEKIIELCPLCQNPGEAFNEDELFICKNCLGIFRPKKSQLTPFEEKLRYKTHNNDVNDKRYQKFVSPITTSILNEFTPKDTGLDFGAGTGPVISKILKEKNYNISQYDPFFYNNPELLEEKYDYIACCEVIEHFYNPQKEFKLLKKLLKPKGILYCMTHIYNPDIQFADWYYKKDPTHVFIYQKETFKWIKKQFDFSTMTIDDRLIRLIN